MKRVYLILGLLVLSTLVYGCASNDKSQKKDTVTEMSGNAQQEGITTEVTYKKMQDENVMSYDLSFKDFEVEQCCDILLDRYDTTQKPKTYDNGLVYIENKKEVLAFVSGKLMYSHNETASDLEGMIMDRTVLMRHNNTFEFDDEADVDEKMRTKVEDELTRMCLNEGEALELKKVIIRDKEGVMSLVRQLEYGTSADDSLKEESNFEDGTYTYLLYEITKNGIPLMGAVESDQSYANDSFHPQTSYISAVCLNDKLIAINAQGLYDYKKKKKKKIISEDKAVEMAEKEIATTSKNNTYEAEDVHLEYVEIPDHTAQTYLPDKMIPYWCVTEKNAINDVRMFRFNAYTGGDLTYDE